MSKWKVALTVVVLGLLLAYALPVQWLAGGLLPLVWWFFTDCSSDDGAPVEAPARFSYVRTGSCSGMLLVNDLTVAAPP